MGEHWTSRRPPRSALPTTGRGCGRPYSPNVQTKKLKSGEPLLQHLKAAVAQMLGSHPVPSDRGRLQGSQCRRGNDIRAPSPGTARCAGCRHANGERDGASDLDFVFHQHRKAVDVFGSLDGRRAEIAIRQATHRYPVSVTLTTKPAILAAILETDVSRRPVSCNSILNVDTGDSAHL